MLVQFIGQMVANIAIDICTACNDVCVTAKFEAQQNTIAKKPSRMRVGFSNHSLNTIQSTCTHARLRIIIYK